MVSVLGNSPISNKNDTMTGDEVKILATLSPKKHNILFNLSPA
jgi:hypothetical protein